MAEFSVQVLQWVSVFLCVWTDFLQCRQCGQHTNNLFGIPIENKAS